jgi:toxin ParE1/3/4
MAGRVRRDSSARRDLLKHFLLIADSSPAAAKRFLRAAGKAMTMLASMPELGGSWELKNPEGIDLRVWPIRGFEHYLIFYRARSDGIRVVRILHAAQDINKALESLQFSSARSRQSRWHTGPRLRRSGGPCRPGHCRCRFVGRPMSTCQSSTSTTTLMCFRFARRPAVAAIHGRACKISAVHASEY